MLPMNKLKQIRGLTIEATHHAGAILAQDLPEALEDLEAVLASFSIQKQELIDAGGGQTTITQRLRDALYARQLKKRNITQRHIISQGIKGEDLELPSESHEIDHVKSYPGGLLALEIEWNNKDPFLDRDLENYRKLHLVGFLSVGVIVTRGATLQARLPEIFVEHYSRYTRIEDIECTLKQRAHIAKRLEVAQRKGKPLTVGQAAGAVLAASKFGQATTHWDKLKVRVEERALGKPCPLLLIGIEVEKVSDFDSSQVVEVGALPVDPEVVAEADGIEPESE